MCRAASRVGCRDKEDMRAVREGEAGFEGDRRGGGVVARMWV